MTDEAVEAEATPEINPLLAPASNPDLRWYVVHAYSGMEKAVERNLRERINRSGMQDKFGRILVPTEEVVEVKNGQKRTTERKFFHGYVLAKLEMNDDVYHLVKNTPKVTGFLGASGKPQPITEAEAARILNTKEETAAAPKQKIKVDFEIGDQVKVLDGPFASFNGLVEELDFDKSKVKVSVSIFGRATPVELDFEQVERSK